MPKFEQHEIDQAKACDIVHVIEGCGVEIKKAGREYIGLCPFHSEGSPSFYVVLHKGFYHCFGCGAHGDPIAFLMEYCSLEFPEAVGQLLGRTPTRFTPPPPRSSVVRDEEPDVWLFQPVAPGIDSEQQPENTICRKIDGTWREIGLTARYAYPNADGSLMGYTARFDLPGGGKEVIPQTYWLDKSTGQAQWLNKAFPKPRPLYGLDRLALNQEAQAVIVEGEKTCDAARKHFIAAGFPESKTVVVTWPGGAQAVKYADFTPLKGRNVALWPDNDDAGTDAMLAIFARLDGAK